MLEPLAKPAWTPAAAAHLLNRAGFGGTPEEIAALHARGPDGAVDSLLHADDDSDLFPPPEASVPERIDKYRTKFAGLTEQERKRVQSEMRREARQLMVGLRSWWLNRMRWSPFVAREKAALFWHGHWATSIEKVKDPFSMWQQNETLRAHALGRFEDMAKDVSRDPAMMRYLDLVQSKSGRPNENFARELMELFTLGEGHYTEEDIQQAARAFTGYRINQFSRRFLMADSQHDAGTKSFFGFEGNFSGDDIIGLITADPQCARFLARKIWTFYASENPPPELVEALAESYRRSGLDTGALLGTIFRSREFHGPDVVRRQIKSPVQWLVQLCRQMEIPLPGQSDGILRELGQVPFAPPNVKGWDGGRAWISSATLLLRYNTSGTILAGAEVNFDALIPPGAGSCDSLAWRLFQGPLSPELSTKFSSYLKDHGTGIAARRDLIHLMMSTPDYQLT